MIEGLRHILYPEVCVACRALLRTGEQLVCGSCLDGFSPYPGTAAGGDALKRVVRDHFGQEDVPAGAWCLYPYRGSGRLHDAMHSLKYEGIFPLGRLFGRKLGELVASSGPTGFDGIVPVPLHRLKLVERTYNQAGKIAEGVAEVLGIPLLPKVIVRRRYTDTQTGLTSSARRLNLHGAFGPGSQPCPPRVLVVDDVVTTGATMTAAAGVLRGCGASLVSFAAVALTEKI
ncbi:MAG: ComF family protein [Chlorobiaceae bacterium]|nr:ComF family protein [Chlorobiaceae bacterium]